MNITSTIPSSPVINIEAIPSQITSSFPLPLNGVMELSSINLQGVRPFIQGVHQNLLATLGRNLDYSKPITSNLNSVRINTDANLPFQLNTNELRSISFDRILDQPHSINSLFSEEIEDLVKNLVEMQNQKLAFAYSLKDKSIDFTVANNISESSRSINKISNEIHSQPNIQINHLLGNSQAEIIQKETPQQRRSSQKPKQVWDEQAETPYSNLRKKEAKSLAKTILLSLGKRLEKISRALQEASN